nr:MAG TPA: hypothetical protein [Caudoviricetes sp.]
MPASHFIIMENRKIQDYTPPLSYILWEKSADMPKIYFIPASNEPSGHVYMSIWLLPRGSDTPMFVPLLV